MRKVVVGAVMLGVIGGTLLITPAFAQTESGEMKTLPERFAEKFNLNANEVKTFFAEVHEERHAKKQVRLDERLTKAVNDGKITEAQKQAILKKVDELWKKKHENMESFKDMTPEERKAEHEKTRAELEAWAKENGIDLEDLPIFFKHKAMMHKAQ